MTNLTLPLNETIEVAFKNYISGHFDEMDKLINSISTPDLLHDLNLIKFNIILANDCLIKGNYEQMETLALESINYCLNYQHFILAIDAYLILIESKERREFFSKAGEFCNEVEYFLTKLVNNADCVFLHRKIWLLLFRGRIEWWNSNYEFALEYFEKCLELSKKIDNSYDIAVSLRNIALVIDSKDKEKSFTYQNQALTIFRKINNSYQVSWSLQNLGHFIASELNDYELALTYFNESLTIREKFGNKYFIYYNLINIGTIHEYKGEFDDALEYYKKGWKIGKELNNEYMLRFCIFSSIELYINKGNLDIVNQLLKEAETSFKITKTEIITKLVLYYKSHYYRMKGMIEESYDTMQKTLSLYEQDKYKEDFFITHLHVWLIILLLQLEKYEEVNNHLVVIKELTTKNTDKIISNRLNQNLNLAEAVIYKNSRRMKEKVKAQEFFEFVVFRENNFVWYRDLATNYLFDMYFEEFSTYGDPQVFEELKILLSKIQERAEKTKSDYLALKSLLLKGKLHFIENENEYGEE